MSNRCAIYCRYSASKQDHGYSLEAQRDSCIEYAQKQGWEVLRLFEDKAVTGTNDQRKAFQEMLELATIEKKSPFEILLVHNTNRFARNRLDSVVNKQLLKKHGVRVVSVMQPYLSNGSPEDVILEGFFEALDEYYSKNLARETLKGMRKHIQNGYWKGGIPPLGYMLNRGIFEGKQRSKLIPNPSEEVAIIKMFKLYSKGFGYKSIVNQLFSAGIKGRLGSNFSITQVQKIIKNENYIGIANFGHGDQAVRVENAHPPLIDDALFEKCNSMLKKKDFVRPKYNNSYLLSGILYCECGAHMVGHSAKSGKYFYYVCNDRIKKASCNLKKIPRDKLESVVINEIRNALITKENVKKILKEIVSEMKENRSGKNKELLQIDSELEDSKRRIGRLLSRLEESDTLHIDDIGPRIRELREKVYTLTNKRIEIESVLRTTVIPKKLTMEESIESMLEMVKEVIEMKSWNKQVVQDIIQSIRIEGDFAKIEYKMPSISGTHSENFGSPTGNRTPAASLKSSCPNH